MEDINVDHIDIIIIIITGVCRVALHVDVGRTQGSSNDIDKCFDSYDETV